MIGKENYRRSIISDLKLGKTTSRQGYNAYMKEYMRRLRHQAFKEDLSEEGKLRQVDQLIAELEANSPA